VPLADAYARALRRLLAPYKRAVEREVVSNLEEWTAQAAHELGMRANASGGDGSIMGPSLDLIEQEVERSFGSRNIVVHEVVDTARGVAFAVDAFSREEVRSGFKRAIGLDLIGDAPHGDSIIRSYIHDNVRLIKTVAPRNLTKVEGLVLQGWRDGKRWEAIAAELRDALEIVDSDAIRIAHDQVGKLNGELSRDRQMAVGVTEGYWRDSSDGRVRKTHRQLDGTKTSLEKGHPTERFPASPVRCRCYVEPIIPDELLEGKAETPNPEPAPEAAPKPASEGAPRRRPRGKPKTRLAKKKAPSTQPTTAMLREELAAMRARNAAAKEELDATRRRVAKLAVEEEQLKRLKELQEAIEAESLKEEIVALERKTKNQETATKSILTKAGLRPATRSRKIN
jgi:SPP1 gp7 family putative phage head morphogenesis protein